MKRKEFYTVMLMGNGVSRLRRITVEKKRAHIALAFVVTLFFLLTAFLTDYFGLYVDKWKLSQLEKENKNLEQKFVFVEGRLKDLERQVQKMSDFSKKVYLITNASTEPARGPSGSGGVFSDSTLLAFSGERFPLRTINSENPQEGEPSFGGAVLGANSLTADKGMELEVRIERLSRQSELVKQDSWALYSSLLERRQIMDSIPTILPVRGWISSGFGYRNETVLDHEPYFHRGMDIASAEGNPVVATADGKIHYAGYDERGYGNLVVIDHGWGVKTYYAHLAEIEPSIVASLAEGKEKFVRRGDVIASVGSTGKSTGPHLHYEIHINKMPVNPENYILDQSDSFIYSSGI